MSIVLANDSDNVTHQLWAQRQANSCAVASIWMARNQALQQTVNEGEWDLAWRIYGRVVEGLDVVPEPPAPTSLDPGSHQANQNTFEDMFSRYGTFMDQVAQALRHEGLIANPSHFSPGMTVTTSWITPTSPAIVLVGWYNAAGNRQGGHFIVASRINSSGQVVYLDPWGGVLRELSSGPGYLATGRMEQMCYISRM